MPTLTTYPVAGDASPIDGAVSREGADETFATIRAGAGTNTVTTGLASAAKIQCSTTSNKFNNLSRCFYCFDTSSIAGGTVSSAILSLYGSSKANNTGTNTDLAIVSTTPASTSALATSDYGNVGSTSFGSVAYASFSTAGYNDITLNASGLANISTSGISKFGSRVEWDRSGTYGATWASLTQIHFTPYKADETGTTKDPKLAVTYTAAGGASSGLDIGGPA